jgi:hypothetical protein
MLARIYHYKLSLMKGDATNSDVMQREMGKQNILEEIKRVQLEIDNKQGGITSLRMDELKLELVRLYKRYTDLVNSH